MGKDVPRRLAELYARFEMEPRPREEGEPEPLGLGPIDILAHGLHVLGVEHESLGEDGFSGLAATCPTERHRSRMEKRLLARALSQMGWCHVRVGVALDDKFSLQFVESCFAHSIRLSKDADDRAAAAEALNGFGTFYQSAAQQVGEAHRTLGDSITVCATKEAPAGRRLTRSYSDRRVSLEAPAASQPMRKGYLKRLRERFSTHGPMIPVDDDGGGERDDDTAERRSSVPASSPRALLRYRAPPPPSGADNSPTPERSRVRFSPMLSLTRDDLWQRAADKLMESPVRPGPFFFFSFRAR